MARTGLIIDPGAGYAQLAAPDGTIRFDTRHQIFHVLSKLSGSLSRPTYSSTIGAPRTANIALGTVDPNCTAVLGLARFNGPFGGAYGFELTSGRWYAVGGTIVLNLERWRNLSGAYVGNYVSACALASFVLVGNTVRYQEELAQKHAASTTQYGAFTVTYRLYAGTFS